MQRVRPTRPHRVPVAVALLPMRPRRHRGPPLDRGPRSPRRPGRLVMGRDELRRWEISARRQCRTDSEHRVLSHVAGCHRHYGKATPGVESIAERTGLGRRTVIRATNALAARGVWRIVSDRPFRDRSGRWRRLRTNLYRPCWTFRNRETPGRTEVPPVAPLCDSESVETGRLWTARRRRRPGGRHKQGAVALPWCSTSCPSCHGDGWIEVPDPRGRSSAPCPGRTGISAPDSTPGGDER